MLAVLMWFACCLNQAQSPWYWEVQTKRHHYNVNSDTIPQTPYINAKDISVAFPVSPPVNACTFTEPFTEPFAAPNVAVGRAKRLVPMSKVAPPASRLTSVPEIVTPAAAALSVTPSTTTKEDCELTSKPSMLISDGI